MSDPDGIELPGPPPAFLITSEATLTIEDVAAIRRGFSDWLDSDRSAPVVLGHGSHLWERSGSTWRHVCHPDGE